MNKVEYLNGSSKSCFMQANIGTISITKSAYKPYSKTFKYKKNSPAHYCIKSV